MKGVRLYNYDKNGQRAEKPFLTSTAIGVSLDGCVDWITGSIYVEITREPGGKVLVNCSLRELIELNTDPDLRKG